MKIKDIVNELYKEQHLTDIVSVSESMLEYMEKLCEIPVKRRYLGICSYLEVSSSSLSYKLMIEIFKLWDHYTGNVSFPVPAPKSYIEDNPNLKVEPEKHIYLRNAYNHETCKWTGEYGELRIDLLNHLIKSLKEIVDEYSN